MKLTSFRVKKYRSIEDSGEIHVDENITAFVGKNESGKTNLLRALTKLNNTQDTTFDALVENPVWYFNKVDPEEVFITATFRLDDVERKKVEEVLGIVLDEIKFSMNRNMKLTCEINSVDTTTDFLKIDKHYFQPVLRILRSLDETILLQIGKNKNEIITLFNSLRNDYKDKYNTTSDISIDKLQNKMNELEQFFNSLPDTISNKQEFQSQYQQIHLHIQKNLPEAIISYLTERLPNFIYFENTKIIDGQIYLPTFINNLNSNNLKESEIITKTLLNLAELNAESLYLKHNSTGDQHAEHKKSDHLSLLLNNASKLVSKKINDVWSQSNHDIVFDVNCEHFNVWIVNKNDQTKLPLKEESRGYQWYFSFYTIFSAESENNHKNAILLLDEPGLFLHPKGQKDFLGEVLPSIAKKNQILYTTHLPFMVDLLNPKNIRTVTLKVIESDDETKKTISEISNKQWTNDTEALFPLQSALSYDMAQSMFIGKKNLIVEGMSDIRILNVMSSILKKYDKTHLRADITLVPAGGASRSEALIRMYTSQNLDVAVMFDSDSSGKKARDRIIKDEILDEEKIILINKIINDDNKEMSIEDLFDNDDYLNFVQLSYEKELIKNEISEIDLTDKHHPMIVKRLDQFFKENNLPEFNKTYVTNKLLTDLDQSDKNLSDNLLNDFEKIFEKINTLFV